MSSVDINQSYVIHTDSDDKKFLKEIDNIVQRYRRKLLRKTLRERDGDNCHYCGGTMSFKEVDVPSSATIEHIECQFDGGTDDMENLVLACKACNNTRSRIPYRIFRESRIVLRPLWGACSIPAGTAKAVVHSLDVLFGCGSRKPSLTDLSPPEE